MTKPSAHQKAVNSLPHTAARRRMSLAQAEKDYYAQQALNGGALQARLKAEFLARQSERDAA